MATSRPQLSGSAGADMFLHVQTKRAGKVKGEAVSPGHADDIELIGWQWGVTASSAIGNTQVASRRSYTELVVQKHIDAATTPLMAALATNDEVKEAKLTMRRSGGTQDSFFTIKLQGARIAALHHSGQPDGMTLETVSIAFTKVEVEYRMQRASGLKGAATSFTDELPSAGA